MRIGPFGVWEILIILIVVLLIFGPRRLPEMAKGLGQSVRAFRKEMRDIKEDFNMDERETPGPRSGVSPTTVQEAQQARPPADAPAAHAPSAHAPAVSDERKPEDGPKVEDEKKA